MVGLAAIVNSLDCSLVGMPLPGSGQRYTLQIDLYGAPVSERKDLRAAKRVARGLGLTCTRNGVQGIEKRNPWESPKASDKIPHQQWI